MRNRRLLERLRARDSTAAGIEPVILVIGVFPAATIPMFIRMP